MNKVFSSLMIGLVGSPGVFAATINVATQVDELTTNGKCSLREAVLSANGIAVADCTAGSNSSADVIKIPQGTYILDLSPTAGEDASLEGDLDIVQDKGNLTIQGAGQSTTIIDGFGADRVFEILNFGTPASISINNLTVRNGNEATGGGIASASAKLTLTNVTLSGNAAGRGAGIFGFGGPLTLRSTTVKNNVAQVEGGGVFCLASTMKIELSSINNNDGGLAGGGVVSQECVTDITASTVKDNKALQAGGGVLASSGGTLTVKLSSISGNVASGDPGGAFGGGLFVGNPVVSPSAIKAFIIGSALTKNKADFGGGIYVSADPGAFSSLLVVSASVLSYNEAVSNGGGIYNDGFFGGPVSATVKLSLIDHNKAAQGGGIWNGGGFATLAVRWSTISANEALDGGFGFGGGILNINASATVSKTTLSGNSGKLFGGGVANIQGGTLTMKNSTVSGNVLSVAGSGAGVASVDSAQTFVNNSTITKNVGGSGVASVQANLTLFHALVANQNLSADCETAFGGIITSSGFNLDSDSSCALTGTGDISSGNAMLGALQFNGGPTKTHALLTGSAAINAGDLTCGVTRDQRGRKRPPLISGKCDIGAFEVQTSNYGDDGQYGDDDDN